MALAAAMHHREHDRIRKAAEYKSTRKSSAAAELTLGGVGRLRRVLHLETKASKRRRKAGVSKGEVKSMAATRMQHARERRCRRGISPWLRPAQGCVCCCGGGRSARDYVGVTRELSGETLMGPFRAEPAALPFRGFSFSCPCRYMGQNSVHLNKRP